MFSVPLIVLRRLFTRQNANGRKPSQVRRQQTLSRIGMLASEALESRNLLAPLTFYNDDWTFGTDLDGSNSLSSGDIVIASTANGAVQATYAVAGFGSVTSGAFTGTLAGAGAIQNALDATDNGGTANLLAGSYSQQITVDHNIAVLGFEPGVVLNGTTAAVTVTGSGVTLDNLAIHTGGTGIGIDIDGGAATLQNNTIDNNATGVRLTNSGAVTGFSNNDFASGTDNGTDLLLTATAGTFAPGATGGNDFGGDTFFVENLSNNNVNLTAAGNTFEAADNFDIEDGIHHVVDTDVTSTGLVTWVAGNIYVTNDGTDNNIQRGIDFSSAGNTVNVEIGSYTEYLNINKDITLLAEGAGTIITTPGSVANQLVQITADGVTIDGFELQVVRPNTTAGIAVFDKTGVSILNNDVQISGTGGGPFVSVAGNTSSVGIAVIQGATTPKPVTIQGNTVGTVGPAFFNRGMWLFQASGLVGGATPAEGNIVAGGAQDILAAFVYNGMTLQNNTFLGAGLDVTEPSPGATTVDVLDNHFLPGSPLFAQSLMVKHNYGNGVVNIQGNEFTGHGNVAILSGASHNVNVIGNTFTPAATATNFSHILFSTQPQTGSASPFPIADNSITIQGNEFNNVSGAVGRAIDMQNVNTTGSGFGAIVVGGAGAGEANTFAADLPEFIRLTPTELAPHPGPTPGTPGPFAQNIDATGNLYGVTGALAGESPANMSLAQLFEVEDKISHKTDDASVGFVRVKAGEVFVTTDSGSIQRGVDAATAGDTVFVTAGTFVENVSINKALTLSGAQAGQDADTRAAAFVAGKADDTVETVLTVPTNAPTAGNPGANDLIRVLASGITVDGLVLDGNNADLDAGGDLIAPNGVHIHARRGIVNADVNGTFFDVNNLLVQNNIIQNVAQRGISLANNLVAATGNVIDSNLVRNFGADPVNGGHGIILFTNFYADVTNNTIVDQQGDGFAIGLQLQNFHVNGSMTWSGNDITVAQDDIGIVANLFYAPNATLNINNNTINSATGVAAGSDFTWGIYALSVQVGSTISMSGNTIGSAGGEFDRGINLWNLPTTNTVSVSGGSIGNSTIGIALDSVDQFFGNGSTTTANITNVDITADVGIRVANETVLGDVPSGSVRANISGGSINATTTGILIKDAVADGFTASAQFLGGTEIDGGITGLLVDGAQTAIVGNDLSTTSFSGQTGDYITLTNGALLGAKVDATGASFDGLTGATAGLAGNFAIEDKITHATDDGSLGFIRVKEDEVFVTTASGSIQRGVNAADSGDTVNVTAGTFEENVTVPKSLILLGANSGVNPNTGTRGAETIVLPATTQTSVQGSTSGTIFRVGTGSGHVDVTIDGFTIDGHNENLVGGRTLNGVEVHTGAGIVNSIGSFDTNPGGYDATLIVRNNVIQNLERYGVLVDNIASRPGVAGNDVSFNKIDNLPSGNNFGGDRGRGVAFEENVYGSVTFNVITRVNVGWQNDNYNLASPGAGTLVDNNEIHTYHRGIFHNLQYQDATPATISNNDIFVETDGDFPASATNFGIELASIQSAVGATVTDNNVTGTVYGILLWNNPTTGLIDISGGTLSGNQIGILATGNDPQFGAGAASSATISGVTITGATIAGISIDDDSASGLQTLEISDTSISGGPIGLLVTGANAAVSGALDIDFTGQTTYIQLADGAMDNQEIDATSSTFDGESGATATLAENFAIEDKITHAIDAATLGLVRVKAGEVFVTTSSGVIQRGIDAATAGDTVNVQAGTYVENVSVNKRVTIDGEGSGVGGTIVTAAAANLGTFTVSTGGLDATNRLVIRDLQATGANGGLGNASSGIWLLWSGSIGFITIDNVAAVNNSGNGIAFDSAGSFTDFVVNNSNLSNNGNAGLRIPSSIASFDGLTMTGGQIDGNGGTGLSVNPSISDTPNLDNFHITGTSFTGNGTNSFAGAGLGVGDISLNGFNGDASFTDVTVTGLPSNGAHIAIQLRGQNTVEPGGTVSFDNVVVTGSYRRPSGAMSNPGGPGGGIVIQNYTDVSGFSFEDVSVNLTDGHALTVTGLTNTLDLGNTSLTAQNANSFDITIGTSTQNPVLSNVDATGAILSGIDVASASLTQLYAAADRVLDGVDISGLGLVRLKANNVYVTTNSFLSPVTTTPSIQRGVDVATAGDTVNVQAGTYKENVTVNKALTLLGANVGVAGNGSRGTETIVLTNGAQNAVFTVSASNVTIDGFKIDGDDPLVTTAPLSSGDDANVLYGVRASGAFSNIDVQNNIITRAFIGFRGDGVASGSSIDSNWFDSIGNFDFGYAVSLRTNFYADVTNNLMTRVWTGLHTNNFSAAGGPATWTMSGNEVHSYAAGLWYNLQYQNATPLTVDNNDFSAETGAVADNFGILIVSIQDAVNPSFTNNTITGTDYGVGLFNVPTTSTITLGSTNSVTNPQLAGVLLTNNLDFNPIGTTNFLAGGPGFASTVNLSLSISGAVVSGIVVDATGGTATNATITGSVVTGSITGSIGLDLQGAAATASLTGSTLSGFATGIDNKGGSLTVSGSELTGSGGSGIRLDGAIAGSAVINVTGNKINGFNTGIAADAFAGSVDVNVSNNDLSGNATNAISSLSGALIDASSNWFGTNTPSGVAASVSGNVDYSPWFDVGTDTDGGATGFAGDLNVLHVDDNSPQTGSVGRIDEALASLIDGGDVFIYSGTYNENVDATSVGATLNLGTGSANVTINGSLTLDADDVLDLQLGNNPGTSGDFLNVTGMVTLGGAEANLTAVEALAPNNSLVVFRRGPGSSDEFGNVAPLEQFTFGSDTVTARYDLADGNDFGFATEANPSISGVSGTVTFTEDGPAVSIAPSATVFDPDTSAFNGGSVSVSYISGAGTSDVLFVTNIGSGTGQIGVSGTSVQYEGVTFGTISGGTSGSSLTITFTNDGNATLAAVQALLRAIAYTNTSNNPGLTNELVILLEDGTGGVGAATVDVNVTPVNDAPILQTSPKPSLGSVAEDTPAASVPGILVSSILGGVSDPDGSSALQGIAVIDLTEKVRGTWQYSLDGGGTWLPMGAPTESAALLLVPANLVRFVPNANYEGTPQLKFRAWDQSNSLAAGSVVNVTGQTGGTNAYSSASVSAKLTVSGVNDAPVLQTSPQPSLGTVSENTPAASVPGIPVSTITGGITDIDAGAVQGIAVVGLTERFQGTWQYSIDGGSNWLSIGDPTETQALLLSPTDLVRFVPNPGYHGVPQLKFRAWDQSNSLTGGTIADTTGQTGGTGAYSTASVSAKLTVNGNPQVTLSGTVGYAADSPAITLAPSALVTDDSADFAGGQLSVSITTGAGAANLLAVSGAFTVDGSNNVLQGATIIGTLNANGGEGTTDLIVTFNSSANASVAQALIRSIKFSTIGGSAGTRNVVFSLTDGDGGISDDRTKTVNVT